MSLILGVVGLPASPRYDALGASDSGLADRAEKLFAKTGLIVKVGTKFSITISPDRADEARIGWGSPGPMTTRLIVDSCRAIIPGAIWLNFAGGYWVSRPMCLPIIVQADGRRQRVLIGVGTTCPGQRPVPTT